MVEEASVCCPRLSDGSRWTRGRVPRRLLRLLVGGVIFLGLWVYLTIAASSAQATPAAGSDPVSLGAQAEKAGQSEKSTTGDPDAHGEQGSQVPVVEDDPSPSSAGASRAEAPEPSREPAADRGEERQAPFEAETTPERPQESTWEAKPQPTQEQAPEPPPSPDVESGSGSEPAAEPLLPAPAPSGAVPDADIEPAEAVVAGATSCPNAAVPGTDAAVQGTDPTALTAPPVTAVAPEPCASPPTAGTAAGVVAQAPLVPDGPAPVPPVLIVTDGTAPPARSGAALCGRDAGGSRFPAYPHTTTHDGGWSADGSDAASLSRGETDPPHTPAPSPLPPLPAPLPPLPPPVAPVMIAGGGASGVGGHNEGSGPPEVVLSWDCSLVPPLTIGEPSPRGGAMPIAGVADPGFRPD